MQTPEMDVAALATLARIAVDKQEADRLKEQMPRILEYVGQLQAVPAELVAVVPTAAVLRPDVIETSATRDKILERAPERQGDFWSVKPVL